MAEPWQDAFRFGILPQMTTPWLRLLLAGIDADDPQLVQGFTAAPVEFVDPQKSCPERVLGIPATGGCAVGYPIARERPRTVAEVEELAGHVMMMCNRVVGKPSSWSDFSAFFDDGWDGRKSLTRAEVLSRLREEVVAELARREALGPA